eukprot:GCRY01003160.1.p1 GENE.GCRY01003160.1~~GCRY01003160.1.p1  ORF type:complete len:143 (+),score=17.95 GCRY01003160.1:144-572(+)
MIDFLLLVNKQGQTRVSQYWTKMGKKERGVLEGELVRKCLSRSDFQSSFLEYRQFKIIYRRYASLFFIVGCHGNENELALFELIQNIVETLDIYFENVCELDIMFNLERVHYIIDEIVMDGCIMETGKKTVLDTLCLIDQYK